jgi:hypothetical protein
LYLAGSLASIVWLNDASEGRHWIAFAPQILACLAAGWLLRGWIWWAAALAFVPAVLAGPFGSPEHVYEEGPPLALIELVVSPLYLLLILAAWRTQLVLSGRRGR